MNYFLKDLPAKLLKEKRFPDLQRSDIATLSALGHHHNNEMSHSSPSQEVLAEDVRVHTRTISNCIRRLKEHGLISVQVLCQTNGKGMTRVRYYLHYWKKEDLIDQTGKPVEGVEPWMFKHVYTPPLGRKGMMDPGEGRVELWKPEGWVEGQLMQSCAPGQSHETNTHHQKTDVPGVRTNWAPHTRPMRDSNEMNVPITRSECADHTKSHRNHKGMNLNVHLEEIPRAKPKPDPCGFGGEPYGSCESVLETGQELDLDQELEQERAWRHFVWSGNEPDPELFAADPVLASLSLPGLSAGTNSIMN